MISLRKLSVFYDKNLIFYSYLVSSKFLGMFSYICLSGKELNTFLYFVFFFNLKYLSFFSFNYFNFKFFNFFSKSSLVVFFNDLSIFSSFIAKLSSNFFLTGFCYNFFFIPVEK